MISIRRAEDRGLTRTAWLDSRHSFSFAHYYDPKHMGFGPLRVINDDRVAPGGGFPPTPTTIWKLSPTFSKARWSTRTASAAAR